jgi:hypothetical protein
VGSKSCGCSCKYLLLVAPCSTFLWFGNELELGLSHVAISDNEFVYRCVPSRIDFCIDNLHTDYYTFSDWKASPFYCFSLASIWADIDSADI